MSILDIDLSVLEQLSLSKLLILFTHFKILAATLIIATAILYLFYKSKHVYRIDFVCYRPPDTNRVPTSSFQEHIERWEKFSPENVEFQAKVLERSGIGSESYFPTGIHLLPNDQSLNSTLEEVQMVLFSVVQSLFTERKIDPKSIDILITNCSVVCPTPSLASMIINKFGLRSNILSFNLSGMGCSASLLSVSLAKDLLKIHRNSLALILSMESRDKRVAKYVLKHLVRTHIGAEDIYYRCISQEPDNEGITGVNLSKSLQQLAGEALKVNVAKLAMLVLPYSEQIRREISYRDHEGEAEEKLKLRERDIEPSRMTLYKFGNTSSASTWYALSYLEAKGRVKRGDRLWQLAFGSGLKCNSAVWKCIRKLEPESSNAWSDFIHGYPIEVPDVMDH
ncbi:3-ketoacyl-CoA synthase 7 [Morus notabilis]|uniref:very-long-chain 3-oxoacyl-CoA synthase n=1 Tax=Morus notabilis TaxID=981085 RepID=W9S345_9ROSA|nr:3-ketoacyl-CoA synthase 7 [Morus notabilis]